MLNTNALDVPRWQTQSCHQQNDVIVTTFCIIRTKPWDHMWPKGGHTKVFCSDIEQWPNDISNYHTVCLPVILKPLPELELPTQFICYLS